MVLIFEVLLLVVRSESKPRVRCNNTTVRVGILEMETSDFCDDALIRRAVYIPTLTPRVKALISNLLTTCKYCHQYSNLRLHSNWHSPHTRMARPCLPHFNPKACLMFYYHRTSHLTGTKNISSYKNLIFMRAHFDLIVRFN